MELIEELRHAKGGTVTELADQTDLSPGAVHTHLSTLKQAGYVVQHGTTYSLGPQFLACGESVRNDSELYQASKNEIDELAAESGECVHLIIEHGGKLFALYERFGPKAVGVELHNRKREEPLDHLHCTAAGKAILAHLPGDRAKDIIHRSKLPQNTSNTITDPTKLADELDDVRQRGYAFADEEQMQGIRAVGAPVLDAEGGVRGAIALSGPTSRLQDATFHEEFPEMVTQAANICEVNLQTATFEEQYM
jgi:DNA-binding IclR family transcriptional regulator